MYVSTCLFIKLNTYLLFHLATATLFIACIPFGNERFVVEVNKSCEEGPNECQYELEGPPRPGAEAQTEAVENPANEVGVDVCRAGVELLEEDVTALVDADRFTGALHLCGDGGLGEVLLGIALTCEVPRKHRRDLDAERLEFLAERVAKSLEGGLHG